MSGGVEGKSWSCDALKKYFSDCKPSDDQVVKLVISVVLAALAAVATYYCITHGLALQDRALTGLERFGAGFLLYMGAVGGFVTIGNLMYGTCGNCTKTYTIPDAITQILISIGAPVAAIPFAICAGLEKR